jgi:hypothetical protein
VILTLPNTRHVIIVYLNSRPLYVTHSVSDILRARMLAIACGYEDGDDLDLLRTDPAFKVACGRLPDSGDDLCSQPTVSRWENAPPQPFHSLRERNLGLLRPPSARWCA